MSPFGYGEICWRDFEAVLCGACLVKPDMAHVETRPNIFTPYETYVPVRWDMSYLVEVCRRLLDEPARREHIARTAHARLTEYLTGDDFVTTLGALLHKLGLRAR